MSGKFSKLGEGQIKIGTRVIRGPDWIHKCEDNGEGFVGTIVEFNPLKRLIDVIWDTGRSGQYRADPGQYDLRIFDNAPTGESHPNTVCNFCSNSPIHGMKWTCIKCNIDLCSQCYMSDKHDDTHAFERTDTPECRRFSIGLRKYSTEKVIIRGIFQGAEVVAGPSWMYGIERQDVGYAEGITCWENKYQRGIVNVFWKATNEVQQYRLGAEGCVDIICSRLTETASGGTVYSNHLPVVDFKRLSNYSPKLLFQNPDLVDIYVRIPPLELEIISKRQFHERFQIWKGKWNTHNNKYVNIKMYPKESHADALREARLMSACNHENLLKMYGMTSTSNWIVLEWFSDYTLLQFLKSEFGQKTQLTQIFHIASQVADGLDHLKHRHTFQEDLRLADYILIDNNYTIKLTSVYDIRRVNDRYYPDTNPYGVLLYELITLGEEPYFVATEDTLENYLCNYDKEIAEPVTGVPCPAFYYEIMLRCGLPWRRSVDMLRQPTFAFLHNLFDDYCELQSKSLDIQSILSSDLILENRIETDSYYTTSKKNIWKGTWSTNISKPVYIEECGRWSKNVLRQAPIMRSLEHKHVVKFLGISTDFKKIVIERIYQNNLSKMLLDKTCIIDFRQIVEFAAQIANGMDYLGTKRILHRNLKAFNILVNDNFQTQISGFCRSVTLPENKIIFKATEYLVNTKWTALEGCICNTFTIKSDVWSYGILLTELLSDGRVPYADELDRDIMDRKWLVKKLKRGFRHSQPKKCPDVIYKVMLDCWMEKPENRPTFDYLFDYFDSYFVSAEPVWAAFNESKTVQLDNDSNRMNRDIEEEYSQTTHKENMKDQSKADIDHHRQDEERELQKSREDESSSDESLYNDDVEIGSSTDSEDFKERA